MRISYILFKGQQQVQPDHNVFTTSEKLRNLGLQNCSDVSTFEELICQAQQNKKNEKNSVNMLITNISSLKHIFEQSRNAMKSAKIYGKVLLHTNENGRDWLLTKQMYLGMKGIILKACVNEAQLIQAASEFQNNWNEVKQNLGYEQNDQPQLIKNIPSKEISESDGLREQFLLELLQTLNEKPIQKENSFARTNKSMASQIQNFMSLSALVQQVFQSSNEEIPQQNQRQVSVPPPQQKEKQTIQIIWIDANMSGNQISIHELEDKYDQKIKQCTSLEEGENYLIKSYLKNRELVHLMIFSNSLANFIFESSYFPYPSVVEMVIYCGNEFYAEKNCREHGLLDIVEYTKSPSKLREIIGRKLKKYQLKKT